MPVDARLFDLLTLCAELTEVTDGAFDVSVGRSSRRGVSSAGGAGCRRRRTRRGVGTLRHEARSVRSRAPQCALSCARVWRSTSAVSARDTRWIGWWSCCGRAGGLARHCYTVAAAACSRSAHRRVTSAVGRWRLNIRGSRNGGWGCCGCGIGRWPPRRRPFSIWSTRAANWATFSIAQWLAGGDRGERDGGGSDGGGGRCPGDGVFYPGGRVGAGNLRGESGIGGSAAAGRRGAAGGTWLALGDGAVVGRACVSRALQSTVHLSLRRCHWSGDRSTTRNYFCCGVIGKPRTRCLDYSNSTRC